MMLLSIIIVSWNVRGLLRACLQSIVETRGDLDLEVIVVDGASADGSVEMVRQMFPWVKLIARPDNVGFPKGNNIGMMAASGRYLLFLNPDTVVLAGALQKLLDFLVGHEDVGCVGPQLLNGDGSVQSSRRRFPTLATAFWESTWLQGVAPSFVLSRYYMLDVPDGDVADVDWLSGACFMIPRRVIDVVGVMDEGYFMYSEELDWCRRIKRLGWRVVYLPRAQVVHYVGRSSDQAVTHRHINFQRAKLRYFRKYHGALVALVLRFFLLGSYVWQMGWEGMKGLLGHKRPLRQQRVLAYWAVVRSGLPPAGY